MTIVTPRQINLAGFPVRRALPTIAAREVGPWVFLDHMGPHRFGAGTGVDVIPHPHINLATVTYLFEGEIVHRDSIGTTQTIKPGAINLMVAGSGIAHSERTGAEHRSGSHNVHGLQLWHALPVSNEEDQPSFHHYPANQIPETSDLRGARVRLLIGSAFGLTSPVTTYTRTLYAEVRTDEQAEVALPADQEHLGVYVIAGTLTIGDTTLGTTQFGIREQGESVSAIGTISTVRTHGPAHFVLLGGSPVGKRYMWWNFVSSRIDRIEQAKSDWSRGGFGQVIDDSDTRASLPESDSHARMKP